jgi:hypothetical protein
MPPSDPGHRPQRGRQAAAPLAPASPAVQQRAGAALAVSLLSLASMLGLNNLARGLYVVLYGLVAGVVALWLAITAITRARRDGTARPRGSVTATAIAGAGTVLSAIMLAAFVALGSQLSAYGNCLAGANTITSRQACQSQFRQAVSRELAALRAASG